MKLSEAEISEIVQLLRDADFDDLELEWGDIYVRIANRSALSEDSVFQRMPVTPSSVAAYGSSPAQQRQPILTEEPAATSAVEAPPQGVVEVRSSLMGTVYRAPQPGDLAFVEVGSPVQKGDTLCLLEVMKVFTALKADVAGTIERILISDGDLVDYNQVIFWIRPV